MTLNSPAFYSDNGKLQIKVQVVYNLYDRTVVDYIPTLTSKMFRMKRNSTFSVPTLTTTAVVANADNANLASAGERTTRISQLAIVLEGLKALLERIR